MAEARRRGGPSEARSVTWATDIVDLELPWDPGRPAAAEADLRRQRAALGEGDLPRSIELATQIARAQALQGKLGDADSTLSEAERAVAHLGENAGPARLRVLLERGRLLTLQKTPSRARELFLQVWNLHAQPGATFYAIDAARMLSLIETPKQRHDWTLRALELVEASPDPRIQRWRGALYTSQAWHLFEQLQLAKALACFERALACYEADGATRRCIVARSSIGRTLRAMNRIPEALAIQEALLGELSRLGDADGLVLEEIAECLQALRRPDEAAPYFGRAYALLSTDEWFNDNESARVRRMKTLGKVKAASADDR